MTALMSGVALTMAACGNSNQNQTANTHFKESVPKKDIIKVGHVSVAV